MKKTSFLIILLFFCGYVKAQPLHKFRLGITAHPAFGFLKVAKNKGKSEGLSLGFSYGLLGDFDLASDCSFSTGLTITTINGKSTEFNVPSFYNPDNGLLTYSLKYKIQYLEIPFTIKLKTDNEKTERWYGQLGLSNGFAISRRYNVQQDNYVLAHNQNAAKYVNFYRGGLIIGGGLERDLDQKITLALGLTLNKGFVNMVPGKKRGEPGSGPVRNHYVGLNMGVFF